jgi:hypothetical protein
MIALVAVGVGGRNCLPFLCGAFCHALKSARSLWGTFLGSKRWHQNGSKVVVIIFCAKNVFDFAGKVCTERARSTYIAEIVIVDPRMLGIHRALQGRLLLVCWVLQTLGPCVLGQLIQEGVHAAWHLAIFFQAQLLVACILIVAMVFTVAQGVFITKTIYWAMVAVTIAVGINIAALAITIAKRATLFIEWCDLASCVLCTPAALAAVDLLMMLHYRLPIGAFANALYLMVFEHTTEFLLCEQHLKKLGDGLNHLGVELFAC